MKHRRPSDLNPPLSGRGYANLGVIEMQFIPARVDGPTPRDVVGLPDGMMVYPEEAQAYAVGEWEGWVVRDGWLVNPLELQLYPPHGG